MGKIPIGLQVYSVRQDAEADLAGTLAKIAKMGYDGVDFAEIGRASCRERV